MHTSISSGSTYLCASLQLNGHASAGLTRMQSCLATRTLHAVRARPVVTTRRCSSTCSALDPKKTALVLIEYQNEFTTPGGKLHDAVKDVMKETQMLPTTVTTVENARKKGAMIIHAPITFSDDYKELPSSPYGILANVKASGSFKKSEWGSQICDELTPKPEDVIVEGKRGLCGFESTNLDFILRQRGIENVVLGGFLTNCCVESTMRAAYERGYKVYTLKDCCATTSKDAQESALTHTFPMFSVPVTHDEFLQSLS